MLVIGRRGARSRNGGEEGGRGRIGMRRLLGIGRRVQNRYGGRMGKLRSARSGSPLHSVPIDAGVFACRSDAEHAINSKPP